MVYAFLGLIPSSRFAKCLASVLARERSRSAFCALLVLRHWCICMRLLSWRSSSEMFNLGRPRFLGTHTTETAGSAGRMRVRRVTPVVSSGFDIVCTTFIVNLFGALNPTRHRFPEILSVSPIIPYTFGLIIRTLVGNFEREKFQSSSKLSCFHFI